MIKDPNAGVAVGDRVWCEKFMEIRGISNSDIPNKVHFHGEVKSVNNGYMLMECDGALVSSHVRNIVKMFKVPTTEQTKEPNEKRKNESKSD